MRKITLFLLASAAIIASSFINPYADFEGKIVYTIDLANAKLPSEAKNIMAGSEAVIYIKGNKTRSDMNIGPQTTSTIYDEKANSSVMLMDIMGNKYKIKSDNLKKDTGKKADIKVNTTGETKTVAGYMCKKAEVTLTDKNGVSHLTNIWFTEEIANHMNTSDERSVQFKNIKGMPLEYEIQAQNGMSMKMTAKTVSKESVPDNKFDIPSDYKETTIEDMQKELMQMMQGGQH